MEDAASRKARLKAMRQEAVTAEAAQVDEPVLKFRNYTPRDEKIEHEKLVPANPKRYEAPPPDEDEEAEAAASEDILINVAPKKPNWDLRRDVGRKLEKLERRTQRAMIIIMQQQERERLQEEGGIQD